VKSRFKRYLYRRLKTSFAKSGEDIQVWQILGMPNRGLYVDIGSHHPIRGSNSYFFYLRGWKGICVDPNPSLAELYRRLRPSDVFLDRAVSDSWENLVYYQFEDSKSNLNTLSAELAESLDFPTVRKTELPTTTLEKIFIEFLDDGETIDFLTVDCEGMDEAVLRGNDWSRYRPRVVCVETHSSLAEDISSSLTRLMERAAYELVGKTVLGPRAPGVGSLIFLRQESSG